MPVDIRALRECAEVVRESERKRFRDVAAVDTVIELDRQWRQVIADANEFRRALGETQRSISEIIKASKKKSAGSGPLPESGPPPDLLAEKERLDDRIREASQRAEELLVARDRSLRAVGNLLHEAVPVSQTEDGNAIIRTWGKAHLQEAGLAHWDLLQALGVYDAERGAKVAGRRGYFLQGPGVLLNIALINYSLSFLAKRGYTMLQPPYFMRSDVMGQTAELNDFEDQLYPVLGAEYYLIATAEQPVSAYHRDEHLRPEDLPLRYAAVSPCFRRETGSHGHDAKGLFRVHQFEKVEQFCIASSEDSWGLHEEMLTAAEEFYQSLEIPYRVVDIASGALNSAAARKYDLEAWFPSSGAYRELVSCSNCTDFQARALNVSSGQAGQRAHVHMLNATLCATQRTMCCIAENYANEDGMRVPRALFPFMHGTEIIRYVKTPVGA